MSGAPGQGGTGSRQRWEAGAQRRLRAFVGAEAGLPTTALGNPCIVSRVEGPPASPPGPADTTQCSTWPLADRLAGVRCFTDQGRDIQCCGHGLLCCAALWLAQWGGEGRLTMAGTSVRCRQDTTLTWLAFPRVTCSPCAVPPWAFSVLGSMPEAAAITGGHDGYLIVRFADDFPLRSLALPDTTLAKHTQRAVIATCRSTAKAPGAVQLRYFAPQYATAEDSATGSALRILADYWASQDGIQRLSAAQRSPRGGQLYSRVEAESVWVGGRVIAEAVDGH